MFAKLTDNKFQVTVTDVDDYKTAEDLLADGFFPYEETEQPSEALDSMHYYLAEYYEEDGKIKQRWTVAEYETPQWRIFSKLKILQAAARLGLAGSFISLLQSDPLLYEMWSAAQNINEGNEFFQNGIAIVKQQLGLTDEQIEAILKEVVL